MPSRQRQQNKQQRLLAQERSFEVVAQLWFSKSKGKWSSGHAKRVWDTLERLVLPMMGTLPITELQTSELLAVVQRIDNSGSREQAGRVLQRLKSIYRYAVQCGLCDIDRAASIDPQESLSTTIVQHRPSIPREELPAF